MLLNLDSIRCGFYSGIPKCCILWYESIWYLWIRLGRRIRKIENLRIKYVYARGLNFEYIPCPLCLLRKNVVSIKKCDKCPLDEKWTTHG